MLGATWLVLALAWGACAQAQDARTTVVQNAARQWLAAADKLDGATTWKTAGSKFKQAITMERWTASLRAAREPWGAVQQRASISTRFETQFEGVPPGEYALVRYRTAYEKNSGGHETVTLEREPDGVWRVIGYFVR
jgi:hypothetical protein